MRALVVLCILSLTSLAFGGEKKSSSKGGEGHVEFGLGAMTVKNEFAHHYAYSGPTGYIGAGFGGTISFHAAISGTVRAEGDPTSSAGQNKGNYNGLGLGWVGLGLNLNRWHIESDFVRGEIVHWYKDTGQTGSDYTKDIMRGVDGVRAALQFTFLQTDGGGGLSLGAQYINLTSNSFHQQVSTGGLWTSQYIKGSYRSESIAGFLALQLVF